MTAMMSHHHRREVPVNTCHHVQILLGVGGSRNREGVLFLGCYIARIFTHNFCDKLANQIVYASTN